jgi:hypothetical protein
MATWYYGKPREVIIFLKEDKVNASLSILKDLF